MKYIARFLLFTLCLGFFGQVDLSEVEASSVPQTTTWSKIVEVESGEYTFQSDKEFNTFYIRVLEGEESNYKVWVDDKAEDIAEDMDLDPWKRLHTQDPEEPTEFFVINPTTELRLYAEVAGTLELNFINTSPGETATFSPRMVAQSWDFADFEQHGINIITRSEWGADETLRYADEEAEDEEEIDDDEVEYYQTYADELAIEKVVSKDSGHYLTWPYQYPNKIRKIIVHHTAGTANLDDPAAALRAIYYYHAISREWGDIGYNFIIDTKGNIYEGRAGGDMVVGAHASLANTGSVGISIMGNYQDMQVSSAVEQSLTKLVTYLTAKYDINPVGVESFRGMSLPNIIGHRDVGATACPGDNLYELLPEIRSAVMNNGVINWASDKEYSFTISGNLPYLDIDPTQEKSVAIKLKNTGTERWRTGTKLIPIDTSNEINATISASEMLEPEVDPGETATFMTTVKAGAKSGIQTVNLALQINGEDITTQQFAIPVRVAQPIFEYSLVKATWPKSQLQAGETTGAYVVIKNTSNFTWTKRGETEVRLSTLDQGRKSLFIAEDTSNKRKADDEVSFDPTRLAPMFEESVAPGKNAHFEIDFTAPEKFGEFIERFTLQAPQLGWFPDKGMQFVLNVNTPQAKAEITTAPKQTFFDVMPGERVEIKFTLKNTGDLIWDDRRVDFVSENDYIPVTNSRYDSPVDLGEKSTFKVEIQAPYKVGKFFTKLKMTTGMEDAPDFVQDPGITIGFNVSEVPEFGAKIVGDNIYNLEMNPWETRTVRVEYENVGNSAWHSQGGRFWQTVTMLGTYSPRNRISKFWSPDWVKATRGAILRENTVEPGETGSFDVVLRAPGQVGNYTEAFNPVVDWIEWMPENPVIFNISVKSGSVSSKVVSVKSTEKASTETSSSSSSSKSSISTSSTKSSSTSSVSSTSSFLKSLDIDPIRVKLSFESSSFQITSDKAFAIQTLDGITIENYKAGEVANIANGTFQNKKYDGLRFEGGIMEIVNWDHSPAWNANLNDNRFRGALEIQKYDGDWVIVNELSLEEYMYGLAEVIESEPIEKHKALLVAARTYALWYLTSENKFDVDAPYNASDDPNVFQKYLGYGYELRAPVHMRAVNATYGQVITYKGKLVKTPYFSSSDGRTRSAEEVWGWTNTPYLVSVDDPYCDGMKLNGHGVGMSGQGATLAAEDGKGYEEILKYYYTGIGIEKAY